MNDKYKKKVRLIYGLGYIKDPCVPQTLWFSWGYFASQNKLQLFTDRLSPCRFQWAAEVGFGGLNDWGLQMRGGISSLGELANSSMSSSISVLWQNVPFSLWSYWVFLIATIKSPPPPSSWVFHSWSRSISLWHFPLNLPYFLPHLYWLKLLMFNFQSKISVWGLWEAVDKYMTLATYLVRSCFLNKL